MIPKLHILTVPGLDDERDDIVASYVDDCALQVCVHEDPDRRGVMTNWLNAADCALNDKTTWSLIIQDDAVGMPGWKSKIDEALWYSPAPVVSLSYFGSQTDTAQKRGVPYMVGPNLIWGAAVGYRRDFLQNLVPWARWIYDETGYTHDDRLICAYAMKIGADTAVTTRALFDQPVEKSTLGHGGGNRRPHHTLRSTSGAPYGARPRAMRIKSGGAMDQLRWLADYGTPQADPNISFETIRNGAVRKVVKEQS